MLNVNRFISVFISFCGLLVLFGWFAGINSIKSIVNGWDAMMPSSAALFFFTGMFLYCEQKEGTCPRIFRENVLMAIAGVVCVTIWWQGIVVSSKLLGRQEFSNQADQLMPYMPSLVTSLIFFAIFIHSLFLPIIQSRWPRIFVSSVLILSSVCALTGYIFSIPVLYFKYGALNAMALHSAILFFLSGVVIAGPPKTKS